MPREGDRERERERGGERGREAERKREGEGWYLVRQKDAEVGGGGGSWELTAATTLTRSFPHSCRCTAAVQVVQRPRLRGRR